MIAAMTVEGVLQADNGEAVIAEGARLYFTLSDHYRLILVSDTDNLRLLDHWLTVNGLTAHVQLIAPKVSDSPHKAIRRVNQISKIRAEGTPIGLVIDPDPAVIRETMLAGMPSMLFLHPRYSRPSFRPDWQGTPTPWSELSGEIERQNLMKFADKRKGNE